jgi:isopentenyl diphosphate isomerase/L-lactate dehydrogenase-like FMN-dependent dehydrogenase
VLGGGKDGAAAYLDKISQELVQAMVLTGTASVQSVDRSILWQK